MAVRLAALLYASVLSSAACFRRLHYATSVNEGTLAKEAEGLTSDTPRMKEVSGCFDEENSRLKIIAGKRMALGVNAGASNFYTAAIDNFIGLDGVWEVASAHSEWEWELEELAADNCHQLAAQRTLEAVKETKDAVGMVLNVVRQSSADRNRILNILQAQGEQTQQVMRHVQNKLNTQIMKVSSETAMIGVKLDKLMKKVLQNGEKIERATYVTLSSSFSANVAVISGAFSDHEAAVGRLNRHNLQLVALEPNEDAIREWITAGTLVRESVSTQLLGAWTRARDGLASLSATLVSGSFLPLHYEQRMKAEAFALFGERNLTGQCGPFFKDLGKFVLDLRTNVFEKDELLNVVLQMASKAAAIQKVVSSVFPDQHETMSFDLQVSALSISQAFSSLRASLTSDTGLFLTQLLGVVLPTECPITTQCQAAAAQQARGTDTEQMVMWDSTTVALNPGRLLADRFILKDLLFECSKPAETDDSYRFVKYSGVLPTVDSRHFQLVGELATGKCADHICGHGKQPLKYAPEWCPTMKCIDDACCDRGPMSRVVPLQFKPDSSRLSKTVWYPSFSKRKEYYKNEDRPEEFEYQRVTSHYYYKNGWPVFREHTKSQLFLNDQGRWEFSSLAGLPSGVDTKEGTLQSKYKAPACKMARVKSSGYDHSNIVSFHLGDEEIPFTTGRGLNIVVIDPLTQEPISSKTYDFYGRGRVADEEFKNDMRSLPTGQIVLAALQDTGMEILQSSEKDALYEIGSTFAGGKTREGYALISSMHGLAVAEAQGNTVTITGRIPCQGLAIPPQEVNEWVWVHGESETPEPRLKVEESPLTELGCRGPESDKCRLLKVPSCMQPNTKWLQPDMELNMLGAEMTKETDPEACQARCEREKGCEHFSWRSKRWVGEISVSFSSEDFGKKPLEGSDVWCFLQDGRAKLYDTGTMWTDSVVRRDGTPLLWEHRPPSTNDPKVGFFSGPRQCPEVSNEKYFVFKWDKIVLAMASSMEKLRSETTVNSEL